jgi:RNA polymerase sigma-54 factor
LFEPHGVGAFSIRESLLIQLKCLNKEKTLAYCSIKDNYNEFLQNHIPSIQKKINCPFQEIKEAIEKDIIPLNVHPGIHFSSQAVQTIIPDETLRQEGDGLIVDVDRDYVPTLKINRRYLKLLNESNTPKTKQFIKRHLSSARWLMTNLQ